MKKRKIGKRKSKSWRKRIPVCTICTKYRWAGNSKKRFGHTYKRQILKGT